MRGKELEQLHGITVFYRNWHEAVTFFFFLSALLKTTAQVGSEKQTPV